MFPKRMWMLPTVALALALVLTSVFATTVQAQGINDLPAVDPGGKYCIKGIVIDWEEDTLGGWTVRVENPAGDIFEDVSDPNENEDEGTFEFKEWEIYPPNGETFIGLPGVYTATIDLPLGEETLWAGVTPTTINFEIEAGRHDCVNIRFKMKKIVPVTVFKVDANHLPLPNWTIDAIPGPGNLFAEPQTETTDDINGSVVFTLTPGVWIFSERQPEPSEDEDRPDRYTPVVPPTGRSELDVQWPPDPDLPYQIVFKNEFSDNGCVIVRKWGLPPPVEVPTTAGEPIDRPDYVGEPIGAAGWGFQIQMTDGTVFSTGVTDAEGNLVFRNLPYGRYVVVEEDRPGWEEDPLGQVQDVIVTSGDCIPLHFVNTQDNSGFCIEGYKLDANGLYGIPNWEIEVKPVHAGGWDVEYEQLETGFYDNDPYYLTENKFVTDGIGKYVIRFPDNDYRIPGQQFEVCEDDFVDGWLPHTPTCQTVTLPDHPGACVKAQDFINEQVGHAETEKMKDEQDHNGGENGGNNGGENGGNNGGENGGNNGGDMGWDGVPGGPGGPGGHKGGDMQCKNTHVVKPGETLFTIGDSYDVSPQAMVDANPSVRSTPDFWVYVGQTLCIP